MVLMIHFDFLIDLKNLIKLQTKAIKPKNAIENPAPYFNNKYVDGIVKKFRVDTIAEIRLIARITSMITSFLIIFIKDIFSKSFIKVLLDG